MVTYLFQPEQSFLARCWWQLYPAPIAAQDAVWPRTDLAPLWVEFHSEGRWDRHWRAEPEGEMQRDLAPHHYHSAQHLFCELFWFGVYQGGPAADFPSLRYEIRPVDRAWMRYNWTLQSKRFGVLGFWETSRAAGTSALAEDAWLWRIDALKPGRLRTGMRLHNLELVDARGATVSRQVRPEMAGLGVGHGMSTLLTLEILNRPHGATAPGTSSGC